MTRITSHGTTVSWAGFELEATSVTYAASAGNEIEITSLASGVVYDPDNLWRKFVIQDYDTCFAGEAAEVTVEFFASPGTNLTGFVGRRRLLSVTMPNGDGSSPVIITVTNAPVQPATSPLASYTFTRYAILSSLNYTASTGEYVRGSATFRLTG